MVVSSNYPCCNFEGEKQHGHIYIYIYTPIYIHIYCHSIYYHIFAYRFSCHGVGHSERSFKKNLGIDGGPCGNFPDRSIFADQGVELGLPATWAMPLCTKPKPPPKKQQQSHRLLRKEWNNWKELTIVKTFGNPPSVFHSLWLVGRTHHAGPWTGPCPTSMLTASDADLALPELLWTLRSSVAAVEVRIDLLRKTWPRAPPEWLPEEVGVKF